MARSRAGSAKGLFRRLENIYLLGVKELHSLRRDTVLVALVVYTFTFSIYSVAEGVNLEMQNASIAVADEDHSELSRRIRDAFLQPFFQPPDSISAAEIDDAMDAGRYSFVVDIPPKFEENLNAGRVPVIQINVDATAMTIAGNGSIYVDNVIQQELASYLRQKTGADEAPLKLTTRAKFNPNLESIRFTTIMELINNVTMMSLMLSGAAVIRERENGTIEHLLVTPVTPSDIMLAKILANGLVVAGAMIVSIYLVVKGALGIELPGSIPLFALGTVVFLFAMTSLGVTLATVVRSMPQFGLLALPFFVVMNMLSGGISPRDAMPKILQIIMTPAPSTPYTSFAQAVLYRGAGLEIVWPQLASMAVIGAVFFSVALVRFRTSMLTSR